MSQDVEISSNPQLAQGVIELVEKDWSDAGEVLSADLDRFIADFLRHEIDQFRTKIAESDVRKRFSELTSAHETATQENRALLNQLLQLRKKAEEEMAMEIEMKRVDKELTVLKHQRNYLQDEITCQKSKLRQTMAVKQCYLEMVAQKDNLQKENQTLRQNISDTTQEIAREKSWKPKLDAMKQQVNMMEKKIANRRAMLENYDDIKKKDAEVEASNAKLEKKRLKLCSELTSLKDVEHKLEACKVNIDELREKNCCLHENVQSLNEELTSKKLLNVQLELLNVEKKALLKRNVSLKENMVELMIQEKNQQPLVNEIEAAGEENEMMRRQNEQMQTSLEELYVKVHNRDIEEVKKNALKEETERMKQLNLGLTKEALHMEARTRQPRT
ncbi:hypothetical protein WMY93_022184 [Mugilogobius chulae]|uniref:Uncharacterized protein n=1 Tax=Mugilogobius chulae TaxID=88201 RepID=A0AAW0NNW7_9GOBI